MKKKLYVFITAILSAVILTACGEDPELVQFRQSIDTLFNKIAEIDSAMNNIDAESDDAVSELLRHLDDLELVFQAFAKLDFPEEFDYLEETAREASQYMTTAVESYHEAYSNGSYNEYTAEYAYGNYARACKRIQVIISFLHGESPKDVTVVSDEEEE